MQIFLRFDIFFVISGGFDIFTESFWDLLGHPVLAI